MLSRWYIWISLIGTSRHPNAFVKSIITTNNRITSTLKHFIYSLRPLNLKWIQLRKYSKNTWNKDLFSKSTKHLNILWGCVSKSIAFRIFRCFNQKQHCSCQQPSIIWLPSNFDRALSFNLTVIGSTQLKNGFRHFVMIEWALKFEITEAIGISHGSKISTLNGHLSMRKLSRRWVLHLLIIEHKPGSVTTMKVY